MQIIAVGGVHMTSENPAPNKAAAEADLLILNGDLTNDGSISEVRQVLDQALAAIPSLLAQFGNLDKPEVNDYLQSLGFNLHSQTRLLNNRVCLIGVGGSNFTPFGTPSEYSENELGRCAQNAYEPARAFIDLAEPIEKIKIPLILVSHTPPSIPQSIGWPTGAASARRRSEALSRPSSQISVSPAISTRLPAWT